MRVKIERLLAAGMALFAVSIASAQSDQGDTAPTTGDEGGSALEPSPELTAQRDVKLTPEQMVKRAEQEIAKMDRTARSVRRQLSEARQERDVVKVLCLNDKLNQIDVALSSASDRQKALQSMVTNDNVDRAKHEFTIIVVLAERVQALQAEANQCVGEELGYVGDTQVTVDIDDDIADPDDDVFPDDPFISDPPRLRSPTY
jgi:hypothetical protein